MERRAADLTRLLPPPLPPQSLLNRLRGRASRAAIAGYRPVRRLSMRSWKGIRCARSQRRTLCHTHSPLLIPPSTTPASVSDPARPLRPFQTASAASGTRSTTNRPAPKGACLACHPLDSPEVRRVKNLSPLSDAAQPVSACIQLPPVPPSRLAAPLSPRGGVGSRYGRALRLRLGNRPRSASAVGLPPSASASAAPAGAPSPPTSPSLPPPRMTSPPLSHYGERGLTGGEVGSTLCEAIPTKDFETV